jgi:hypothetical protein
MKYLFSFILFLTFFSTSTFCQDVIKLRNGETRNVKVLDYSAEEIHCLSESNDTLKFTKDEVSAMDCANGVHILYNEFVSPPDSLLITDNMYLKGTQDAKFYYRKYVPAHTGTLVVSFLSPILGLVPAIVCSSVPPADQNLGIDINGSKNNPEYIAGYKDQAHKIKKHKVWQGYGTGVGAALGLGIVLYLLAII